MHSINNNLQSLVGRVDRSLLLCRRPVRAGLSVPGDVSHRLVAARVRQQTGPALPVNRQSAHLIHRRHPVPQTISPVRVGQRPVPAATPQGLPHTRQLHNTHLRLPAVLSTGRLLLRHLPEARHSQPALPRLPVSRNVLY